MTQTFSFVSEICFVSKKRLFGDFQTVWSCLEWDSFGNLKNVSACFLRAAWIPRHLWLHLIIRGWPSTSTIQILMNLQCGLFDTIQILIKRFQTLFQVLYHFGSFFVHVVLDDSHSILLSKCRWRSRYRFGWDSDFGFVRWIFHPWLLVFLIIARKRSITGTIIMTLTWSF